MLDLYQRLKLGFAADSKAIELAIAKCADPVLAQRAKAVLLVERRRRAYDRTYLPAHQVRQLRDALMLEEAPWALEHDSDFHDRERAATASMQKTTTASEAQPIGDSNEITLVEPAKPAASNDSKSKRWWPFGKGK